MYMYTYIYSDKWRIESKSIRHRNLKVGVEMWWSTSLIDDFSRPSTYLITGEKASRWR